MSKILYIAPFRDFSGYATASRGYLNALDSAGADIVARAIRYDRADSGSEYSPTTRERELLLRPLNGIDVVIQHSTPNELRPTPGKVNIAIVAWETTRIPEYWANKLNKFDAVITFCDASVQAFRDSGVTVPVKKIPHTFDIAPYTLDDIDKISSPSDSNFLKDKFIFYNISQFAAKKGIDILLRSYLGGFHGHEDTLLILKTYINMGGDRNYEREKLCQYITNVKQGMRLPEGGYPKIMLITKTLTKEQIRKIHKTGDCYVCSSRGEGWCIPAFDALAYGNKLVTTTWGGMGEFALLPDNMACRKNVYPVHYSIEPLVGQNHADPELYTSFESVAEPSVNSMINMMRKAYNDRNFINPPPDLMRFDHSTVGPEMLQLINEIVATKVQETSNV